MRVADHPPMPPTRHLRADSPDPASGRGDIFRTFARTMMDARDIRQTELAARTGRTQGFISKVLAGTAPVPWDDLPAWEAALRLTPAQAALLRRYAVLAYGADCMVAVIADLDAATARAATAEGELAVLRDTADSWRRYAEALEREVAEAKAQLKRPGESGTDVPPPA